MLTSPSFVLTWGPGTSAWPLALYPGLPVWTNFLSTAECDQIGVLIDTNGISTATVSVFLQVWWAGASAVGEPLGGPDYFPESIETPGTLSSFAGDTYQRMTLHAKEWGPIPRGKRRSVWVPTAAPYFRISLYTDVAAAGTDSCKTTIVLAALGSPTGTSR